MCGDGGDFLGAPRVSKAVHHVVEGKKEPPGGARFFFIPLRLRLRLRLQWGLSYSCSRHALGCTEYKVERLPRSRRVGLQGLGSKMFSVLFLLNVVI